MSEFSVHHWIDGAAVEPSGVRKFPVWNPSSGELIAETREATPDQVERAVSVAARAFPAWAETPPSDRARVLFRFRELLERDFESLARLITIENGKTLEEARGSLRRGIEVVEFACGAPSLLMGTSLRNVSKGIDGRTEREPLGVCLGISPFNFPAMVPMWMYPIALACGNAFILKPSERVPLSAQGQAALLSEAGLPPGVFNIVQGGREVSEALIAHPMISAVSFVGSTDVAREVYRRATSGGKRCQAGGGAKNHLVILPDSDPERVAKAVIGAAFGCAGQRCMAGSVLVAVGRESGDHIDCLRENVSKLSLGRTDLAPGAEVGPVISPRAQARLRASAAAAVAAGARPLVDRSGETPDEAPEGFYVGPTILEGVPEQAGLFREELFGPVLALTRTSTVEEAADLCNRAAFGNGAVIFTSDGQAAREFSRRVTCGMIGVNVGVPAPQAFFPFNGWNDSFFGDLHMQGTEGVSFYTRQKVILSRWADIGDRRQGW